MDRKVCHEMKKTREKNPFVRGLISWVGFKQTAVEYVRDERLAGETTYPLKKILKLSMDGITSFSYKPLKLASIAGVALSAIGFISMFLVLYLKLFTNSTITGWSSLLVIQLFFSGITLFILGMIGEYIGRIYDEAKDQPLYIVRESYGLQSTTHSVQSPVHFK